MSDTRPQRSTIARILVEAAVVSEQHLVYAERIRSKLEEDRPLLDILKELGGVDEDRVHDTLLARRMEIPLGELLVEFGHIAASDLDAALEIQRSSPDPKPRLGEVLVDQRFVADRELAAALAFQLGIPHLEPDFKDLDRGLLSEAPTSWLVQHEFIPVERRRDQVVVAFSDPMDRDRITAAETVFGKELVVPAIASRGWVRGVLDLLAAGGGPRSSGDPDDSAATHVVDELISNALEREASDIHIEPTPDRLRIRFREDGVLVPFRDFPRDLAAPVSSRIKVLCSADIAEKRRHQDGRFVHKVGEHRLDLRVSIYVTVHGEKIVLRLLNTERRLVAIQDIGMAPRMIERFIDEALERPSGVILVTGPTGSGKTSTLYSCINHINRPETSIITAEDPVEYVMEGVGQCSLNPAINLTYEETLRHIVRQDPDVIVIGEIRDRFSAETAIQAALTGHKVLTTFHTEDSIGGLLRLLNMEIEAFLVSSTVVSVLAQRLLRRVCERCAAAHDPTLAELRRFGYDAKEFEGANLRRGRGCENCRYTGYRGRIAVFELLVIDEPVRDAVLKQATAFEIRRISRESSGLMSLLEDGIVKAANGITTLEEVLRTLPRLDTPRPVRTLQRLLGEER